MKNSHPRGNYHEQWGILFLRWSQQVLKELQGLMFKF